MLLLVFAWVVLAVVWTAVEVLAHLTDGATAYEWFRSLIRLGSVAVGIWILRTFRQPRAGSG